MWPCYLEEIFWMIATIINDIQIHRPFAGELAPRLPTSIRSISITSSSATIQWMLTDPYIPSRPETFTVVYGTISAQLSFTTPEITANPTSQTYSTQLNSLQPGTVYYYRIDGSNQFASISTDVRVFSTLDSG